MKVEDIKQRLEEIMAKLQDDEVAHGLEDDLAKDILTAIAHGESNAQDLAMEAIKTYELDFERWRA